MSQYPSPYQPPQPYPYGSSYPPPPPDLGGYARNAGILMIVLGVLIALFAGCSVAAGFGLADFSQLPPDQRAELEEAEQRAQSELGISFSTLFKVAGAVIAVPAFGMVLLGLFIRRGSTVAIILGLIVSAGAAIVLTMLTVFALPSGKILEACFFVIPLALFVVEGFLLSKAVLNTGPLKVFNEQQQAYQWQMAQHARAQQAYYQQMYQQQGYNYPPQTPPPPPPPQTPDKDIDQPPPT